MGLLGGFILSTLTMVRCRNHWQLLAMAGWKFSMNLLNGVVGIHVAYMDYREATGQGGNQDLVRNREPKFRPWVFGWFAICRWEVYNVSDQFEGSDDGNVQMSRG